MPKIIILHAGEFTGGCEYLAMDVSGVRLRPDSRDTHLSGSRQATRGMLFGGFSKSCNSVQKFDPDTERRFAVLLEDDAAAENCFEPVSGDLFIRYRPMNTHEPDFVVETAEMKYLCETKVQNEMDDGILQKKAEAVRYWCEYAPDHAPGVVERNGIIYGFLMMRWKAG